jgi:hypothetical protein
MKTLPSVLFNLLRSEDFCSAKSLLEVKGKNKLREISRLHIIN